MDTDTIIILMIITVFAVYMGIFNKKVENFEQKIEKVSNNFSPVPQDETPPCYIVKSVYTNDNAKNIKASNYDVYEKEADFDSEYTNMIDYFGSTAKKINQKKYYETITPNEITSCAAPVLEQVEYATSAF